MDCAQHQRLSTSPLSGDVFVTESLLGQLLQPARPVQGRGCESTQGFSVGSVLVGLGADRTWRASWWVKPEGRGCFHTDLPAEDDRH